MAQDQEQEDVFDQTWAPKRYPRYNEGAVGNWRVIFDHDTPVGVLWTDNGQAAGVNWITQTDAVTAIDKHLRAMAAINAPASIAYMLAQQLPGAEFDDEATGELSTVEDTLAQMMSETD